MRYVIARCVVAACGGSKPMATVPAPPATAVTTVNMEPEVVVAPAAVAKLHQVRTVEGITEYRMDNGLQVLMFPDPTQSTVTVNITYLVGSRLEGYGETGR